MARPSLYTALLAAMSVAAGASAAAPAKKPPRKGPTPAEVKKIEAAAPARPRVRPAKPRKVLIYSVSYGYFHSSIPYGKKAFEILGTKTGAYEPVVSDELAMFEPETLKQFDAVVFNNANRDVFLPANFAKLPADKKAEAKKREDRLKKSFADFLASGGGLAVTHAGVAVYRTWDEYGKIIGARFKNHPWGSGSEITVKIDDPKHPAAAAFPEPTFTYKDEVYQVTDPYSRDIVRVLVSIDTTRSNMNKKGLRADMDLAISWVKSYGRGRVFYTAIGHDHPLFWNPVVLQHYLDGVQFACGDLKGDTTPTGKGAPGRPK
jgi:type 1 glutamine amidotransferase